MEFLSIDVKHFSQLDIRLVMLRFSVGTYRTLVASTIRWWGGRGELLFKIFKCRSSETLKFIEWSCYQDYGFLQNFYHFALDQIKINEEFSRWHCHIFEKTEKSLLWSITNHRVYWYNGITKRWRSALESIQSQELPRFLVFISILGVTKTFATLTFGCRNKTSLNVKFISDTSLSGARTS